MNRMVIFKKGFRILISSKTKSAKELKALCPIICKIKKNEHVYCCHSDMRIISVLDTKPNVIILNSNQLSAAYQFKDYEYVIEKTCYKHIERGKFKLSLTIPCSLAIHKDSEIYPLVFDMNSLKNKKEAIFNEPKIAKMNLRENPKTQLIVVLSNRGLPLVFMGSKCNKAQGECINYKWRITRIEKGKQK